jgi:hypothetical protein
MIQRGCEVDARKGHPFSFVFQPQTDCLPSDNWASAVDDFGKKVFSSCYSPSSAIRQRCNMHLTAASKSSVGSQTQVKAGLGPLVNALRAKTSSTACGHAATGLHVCKPGNTEQYAADILQSRFVDYDEK